MGGRVFKNQDGSLQADRISASDYKALKAYFKRTILGYIYRYSKEVEPSRRQDFSNFEFAIPRELEDKESYGDLDILYTADKFDLYHFIINSMPDQLFQADGIVNFADRFKRNGNITHYLYKAENAKQYQIDFIEVPQAVWEDYKFYSNYSALGMLLGNITRHFKVQFSLEGFKFKHTDVRIGPCNKIFEFLCLDKELYEKLENNPTKENLFEFVWSSPFATKEVFESSLASATHRKREANSPVWHEFYQWIQNKEPKEQPWFPQTEMDLYIYLERIFGEEVKANIKEHLFKMFWSKKEVELKKEQISFLKFVKVSFPEVKVINEDNEWFDISAIQNPNITKWFISGNDITPYWIVSRKLCKVYGEFMRSKPGNESIFSFTSYEIEQMIREFWQNRDHKE